MGFFSKKVFKNNNENTSEQEAQKRVNEDGSEWMQKAYETCKSFNDEDMGGGKTHRSEHASTSQRRATRKTHSLQLQS